MSAKRFSEAAEALASKRSKIDRPLVEGDEEASTSLEKAPSAPFSSLYRGVENVEDLSAEMTRSIDPLEARKQAALERCYRLGGSTRVPMEGYDLNPKDRRLEHVFSAFVKSRGEDVLTYSHFRSFNAFGGRLLFAAVCQLSGFVPPFEPSGAAVWQHRWELAEDEQPSTESDEGDASATSDRRLRCFHGYPLEIKTVQYNLRANTAAALEAIKKGTARINQDKGFEYVNITQERYGVCREDARQKKVGTHCLKSCGLAFTDVDKALGAMRFAQRINELYFPRGKTEGLFLFPTACYCNYGGEETLGRQQPKITPWTVSEFRHHYVNREDQVSRALADNPFVFVFNCCNFQLSLKNVKACDFRLSHADALRALVMVKHLLGECFPQEAEAAHLRIPRYRWNDGLRVKLMALPSNELVCPRDEDPFGQE